MSSRVAAAGDRAMSGVLDFPVKPEARAYVEAFVWPPGEPQWLARHREQSLARFAELGLPSRRGEAWRYIDLAPLAESPMPPQRHAAPAIGARGLLDGLGEARYRLVLLDGRFAPELSSIGDLPAGVRLCSTTAAIADRPDLLRPLIEAPPGPARPFALLDAVFFADGFVLELAPGAVIEPPVEIVHLACAEARGSLHTKSFVILGKESRASLCEIFRGEGAYWRNDVVEVALGPGAALDRALVVEEGEAAIHLGESVARLDTGARLASFVLLAGGRTVRQEASLFCEGEGTRSVLHGAALLSGREEGNIVTTVDHLAPGGETRETVKIVGAGRAHGAFQGRITVRRGAQKVDAQQTSRNLIVGRRAVIDTKPELEILADDVKCSHGAAVGDLDEAALFYLAARGISPQEARRMLIEGFLSEAVALVEQPALRRHLERALARRLARLAGEA
ncbi:MAG TPA: Fe-S cluster assembly protein SufD [Stellaceae bacterium]|nr:Fe-S cluster assembly protein SufD [Stellaceae bacterium]